MLVARVWCYVDSVMASAIESVIDCTTDERPRREHGSALQRSYSVCTHPMLFEHGIYILIILCTHSIQSTVPSLGGSENRVSCDAAEFHVSGHRSMCIHIIT